jgi:hypothetical protein
LLLGAFSIFLGIYHISLLFVAELFDFSFSLHRVASAEKSFCVNQLLRFVGFGVSCAVAVLVQAGSRLQVFGVACVVATVTAQQNVNVKRHG